MVKGTRFTDKYIVSLKAIEKEYWVREGQGFTIRVYPSGEKGWYYIYTFDGRKRFMKLGTYPDVSLATARERFDVAKVKVKNGVDPLAEQESAKDERLKAPTLATLIEDYLEKHAKKFKRSWEEDERILNKEVLPFWGKRKAADITKRDVIKLVDDIVDRGAPVMANNTFKIIRKMFNWAVEKDILQASPAYLVKLPAPKVERDRALTEQEIKTLWSGLDNSSVSYEVKRALKLVLVTAQRPGEVTGMHTQEINDRWWTIPPERSKNGKAQRVYLTDTALDLIGALKVLEPKTGKYKDKGFIFPCPHKSKLKPIDRHALSRSLGRNFEFPLTDKNGKQLYDKDGKPATENRLGVDKFTPHDLRRTAATFMASMRIMDEVIDAVLNHAKQGIIKVYNQYRYDAEKQQALEAWERKLKSIITGEQGKVIPISRKAATGE